MFRNRKSAKKSLLISLSIFLSSVAFVVAAGYFAFMIYHLETKEPVAAQVQTILEQEFVKIVPLTQSSSQAFHTSHKSNHALVSDTYVTNSNYEQIYDHYNTELVRNGWVFCKEEQISDWGRDLGGKLIHYQKQDYVASLEFANKEQAGWTYGLSLTWGWKDIYCLK